MLTEHAAMENNISRQTAVIVPVYNTGKNKLTKCIRSILAQSYQQFVLILVDDGSTDDSGAICDGFAVQDARVKVIHQTNKGSVEARKTGVFQKKHRRQNTLPLVIQMIPCPKMHLKSL